MKFTYGWYFVTVATVSTFLRVRTEWVQIPFLSTSQMLITTIKHDEVDLLKSQLKADKTKQIQASSAFEKKHLEYSTHSISGEEQPEERKLKNETINTFAKKINEETLLCANKVCDKPYYNSKGKYKLIINEEIKEPLENVHEEILQEAEEHSGIRSKLALLDDLKGKLIGHAGKIL